MLAEIMHFKFHRVLLLVFLCGWIEFSNSQTVRPITCTAGHFSKCEFGYVQCNFNKDVNKTRHDFNIVHYPFKSTSSTDPGTYVLLCNWQQNGKLECKVEDGFSFNYVVTDRLKLEIPDVSRKVEGKYVCQLVPDGGIHVETCTLTVKDGLQEVASQNKQIHLQTDHDHERLENLIIGMSVGVAAVVIIVNVLICVYLRNRFQLVARDRDSRRQHAAPSPENENLIEGTSNENFTGKQPNSSAEPSKAKGKWGKKGTGQKDETKDSHEMITTASYTDTGGNPALATTRFEFFSGKSAGRTPNTSLSQALDEAEKNLDTLETGEGKSKSKQQGDTEKCILL